MLSLYQRILIAFNKWMGKPVDYDGKYANQCVDWIKQYAKEIRKVITTFGNAKDFAKNGLGPNWKKVYDISPGDIVIFTWGVYGHIAVVQRVEGNTLYVVEQNRDGKAYRNNNEKNLGSPVSLGKYTLTGKEVFFRSV